jgi:GNAT superfamily N-acetyltransferase
MTDFTYRHITGEEARTTALGDELVGAYVDLRAEPPYNSGPLYGKDRYLDRTGKQTGQPGFTLVTVRDEGGALAGFAFGLPFGAGRWWAGEAQPGPPEVVAAPKFAVIELNVLALHRGQGAGKRLLGALLEGRPEPYATLISQPGALAHDLYQRWGWRVVGTVQAAPDAITADAMVLDLTGVGTSAPPTRPTALG